jgi:murein DD-endopeptidase MepM/ murein hydrolase activator NlpD
VDGVREGSIVKRGEVIGYLGAGPATSLEPRLRFAILRFPQDKYWESATAIDPLPYFVKSRARPTLAASR